MNVDSIRNAITQAKSNDGKVDPGELDKIMLQVRDGGGLDATEKAELVKFADGFDDATKQRLMSHLSKLGQTSAWVNIDAGASKVTSIEGRYANMKLDVPGLTGKQGLFDSTFSLKGKATQDGTLKLNVGGQDIQVPVKKGDKPADHSRQAADAAAAGGDGAGVRRRRAPVRRGELQRGDGDQAAERGAHHALQAGRRWG